MKRKKNRNRTFLLFAASAVLLLMSTVGSTRAALTYRSENYEMKFDVLALRCWRTERLSADGTMWMTSGRRSPERF